MSSELVAGVDLCSCLTKVLGGVVGAGIDALGVEDAIGELFAARSGRPGR